MKNVHGIQTTGSEPLVKDYIHTLSQVFTSEKFKLNILVWLNIYKISNRIKPTRLQLIYIFGDEAIVGFHDQ